MPDQAMLVFTIGALIFAAVGFLTFGASEYVAVRQEVLRRLIGSRAATPSAETGSERIVLEDGTLKRFSRLVTPKSQRELSDARARLVRAGYRSPSAVRIYYAARAGLGLAMALLSALVLAFFAAKLSAPVVLAGVLGATLVGFMMPAYWVERRIQYRFEEAELGFPDVLDMLLVCIEAGQGLDQALRRLTREIRNTNPTLSEEFGIVSDELRAGKQRALVLREFADRVSVPDISAFMAVLKQSDEFGVSIADAVRVYAAEMRHKRITRAEEKANLLPVKLALGGIIFTVPPIMLILAGPSFIMILRAFSNIN